MCVCVSVSVSVCACVVCAHAGLPSCTGGRSHLRRVGESSDAATVLLVLLAWRCRVQCRRGIDIAIAKMWDGLASEVLLAVLDALDVPTLLAYARARAKPHPPHTVEGTGQRVPRAWGREHQQQDARQRRRQDVCRAACTGRGCSVARAAADADAGTHERKARTRPRALTHAGDARCGQVNRHWAAVASDDSLWRWRCAEDWLIDGGGGQGPTAGAGASSWRHRYLAERRTWGRYGAVYRPIRRAWNDFERFLEARLPALHASLQRTARARGAGRAPPVASASQRTGFTREGGRAGRRARGEPSRAGDQRVPQRPSWTPPSNRRGKASCGEPKGSLHARHTAHTPCTSDGRGPRPHAPLQKKSPHPARAAAVVPDP